MKQLPQLSSNKSVFLLIFQVPVDVNMIYHSLLFKSHIELLKAVYNNLPPNTRLVIREHPLYVNKYDSNIYNFIKQHDIIIDNITPLQSMLQTADVVIVNNSTVGFEAIINHKPVVVLGNAFYDDDTICLKLKSKTNLKTLLSDALKFAPDTAKVNAFKQLLCSTVLLEGAIIDKDLKSSKTIANHLLAHH